MKLYLQRGGEWLVFSLSETVPIGSPGTPTQDVDILAGLSPGLVQAIENPSSGISVASIMRGTEKEMESSRGMSAHVARDTAIDNLMRDSKHYGNPVGTNAVKTQLSQYLQGVQADAKTMGQGKEIPGTGLLYDDPRVHMIMFPRFTGNGLKKYYKAQAKEAVNRMQGKSDRRHTFSAKQSKGGDFWVFRVWPEGSFSDDPEWGVVKGEYGVEVYVGQARGRRGQDVCPVNQIPGYTPR